MRTWRLMAHDDPNCYDAVIPWSRANNVHHEMQVGDLVSPAGWLRFL
jgi:hypothetical protein